MIDRQRPDSLTIDILSERPEEAPPNLDHLLADNLKHDDLVLIDGLMHKFQHKEKGAGPHVFFDTENQRTSKFFTVELLDRMSDGSYVRPGADAPTAGDLDKLDEAEKQRLRIKLGALRAKPRAKALVKWLYVARFLNKISDAREQGSVFGKSLENAETVTHEVDDLIEKYNLKQDDPKRRLISPARKQPRTVLKWVENQTKRGLAEIGQVHRNALLHHPRRLPQFVFDTIAVTIRELIGISGKMSPEKVYQIVCAKISEHNSLNHAAYPHPSKTLVWQQFKLFDPWYRIAKLKGPKAADLEYGAVGKLIRPSCILELVEMDSHKFDFHGVLGKTSVGRRLSRSGIDRCWICLMLDVHSGYPLGFQLSFEQDSLLTALACVEHAVGVKTYISERWPHINGALLGYGKPVRLRYDNAKVYTGLQMEAGLARVGISFQNSKARIPNSKPYIERFFGTLERDFIEWLKGATGSSPKERGERKPLKEARMPLDEFEMLLHQYLIECYARRPQEDLGYRTPEQVWMAGLNNVATRPRMLTKAESERVDVLASIVVDVTVTREGILWKGIPYQSTSLQALRKSCGKSHKDRGNVHLQGRIPLKDVSAIHVSDPNVDRKSTDPIIELEVSSAHPYVQGRTHFQHQAIRMECARRGRDPDNWEDYRAGLLRLFRGSLAAMGVKLPGADKSKPRLTAGQAGRFTGIFLAGKEKHALHNIERDIKRFDIFGEIAAALKSEARAANALDATRPISYAQTSIALQSDAIELDDDDLVSAPTGFGLPGDNSDG